MKKLAISIMSFLILGSIGVVAHGADAIFIDTAGNVGIGINAPTKKLDVAGDAVFRGNMGIVGNLYIHANLDVNGSVTQMVIDSEGKWVGDKAGLQGDQGVQGPQGDIGQDGPQGLIGDNGPQGPQGDIGPDGPQGLKGDNGSQGPQGNIGPDGPQGLKGDTGPWDPVSPFKP